MCFQWLRVHGLASRLVQHAQKLGSNTILDKLDNASTQVIKPGLEVQLHREFKGSLEIPSQQSVYISFKAGVSMAQWFDPQH